MICFVDFRISLEEELNLSLLGLTPIKIPKSPSLYEAICGHVDIQLNILNKEKKQVIVQKDIPAEFLNTLIKNNISFIKSSSSLSSTYPYDIFLNAFISEGYFVHNLKYTDIALLNEVKNKTLVNVSQGYTKCSILPLKEKVIVTSDKSIYNALTPHGFDILLLPPGDILLPEMNYGFIGGVGGMISSNTLALFGELSHYKYGDKLEDFLKKHNINVLSLKKGKLVDRGSLFVL